MTEDLLDIFNFIAGIVPVLSSHIETVRNVIFSKLHDSVVAERHTFYYGTNYNFFSPYHSVQDLHNNILCITLILILLENLIIMKFVLLLQ